VAEEARAIGCERLRNGRIIDITRITRQMMRDSFPQLFRPIPLVGERLLFTLERSINKILNHAIVLVIFLSGSSRCPIKTQEGGSQGTFPLMKEV
jgi:hypothetical protein